MRDPSNDKESLKAYRNGFGIGAFIGVVLCIVLAKAFYILPIVLGLLFGSIAFEYKNLQDGER
jgi:hypothetical protein